MIIASGAIATVPIIIFDTVSKEFTPESFGLKDISFTIEPGELIFITGHSGSGKTTLMKLLTREYTPTSGEIFFQEEPLSDLSKHSVHTHRRRIGVVFQDYQLVPEMNVWENIALPLYVMGKKEHEIEQRVTDLLNLIKLPEKSDQFPSQLSGGEAQRVSIARALAVGPEVIFADEPTGNLDPDTSLAIARLLKKINELGTTVLIATHDQEVLNTHQNARHMILEKGKIIADSATKKTPVKQATQETQKGTKKTDIELQKSEQVSTTESEKKAEPTKEATIEVEESKQEEKTEKKSGWGSWFSKKEKVDTAAEEKLQSKEKTEKSPEKKDPVTTKKEKQTK